MESPFPVSPEMTYRRRPQKNPEFSLVEFVQNIFLFFASEEIKKQKTLFLCGWPHFGIKPFTPPSLLSTLFKSALLVLLMHIFPPLQHALTAAPLRYRLCLSALGAADKINIRSTQFGSLICRTQSAKAKRVSIPVCCFLISSIAILLSFLLHLCLSALFFSFFLFFGPSSFSPFLPLFLLEGGTFEIRHGGSFNVSLEMSFFFFSEATPTL